MLSYIYNVMMMKISFCIACLRPYILILASFFFFLFISCNNEKQQKIYTIGFSQCQEYDWRKTMLAEMQRELSFHNNVKFIYKHAGGDSKKQAEQINELVKSDIDLLIVSPNEAQPLSAPIGKIFDSGIPVVLIDRGINSNK